MPHLADRPVKRLKKEEFYSYARKKGKAFHLSYKTTYICIRIKKPQNETYR